MNKKTIKTVLMFAVVGAVGYIFLKYKNTPTYILTERLSTAPTENQSLIKKILSDPKNIPSYDPNANWW